MQIYVGFVLGKQYVDNFVSQESGELSSSAVDRGMQKIL